MVPRSTRIILIHGSGPTRTLKTQAAGWWGRKVAVTKMIVWSADCMAKRLGHHIPNMRGARGCAAEKLLKSHGLCRNRCSVSVVDVGCNKIDRDQ